MKPQPRGEAFQRLFAKVVEQNGWSQQESVRTPHEEMDVVIYRGREYYLAECKWERDPIQAPVVRELYGKLGNRAGMQGIVVSMSGFTKGAMKQVQDYKNDKIILLFGREDVYSLIYERASLDELLAEKSSMLVIRGMVVFK